MPDSKLVRRLMAHAAAENTSARRSRSDGMPRIAAAVKKAVSEDASVMGPILDALESVAETSQAGSGPMEQRRTLDQWMNMQQFRPSPAEYSRVMGKDNAALFHYSMYLEGLSEEFHREDFKDDPLETHNPLRRRTVGYKTRRDLEQASQLAMSLTGKLMAMKRPASLPTDDAAELIDRYSRVLPKDIVYYGRPGTRKILEHSHAKPINCILIVKMDNGMASALTRIDGTVLYPISHQGDVAPPRNMRVVGSFSEG